MNQDWLDRMSRAFADAIDLHRQFASNGLPAVGQATAVVVGALKNGGKVLVCGNGGSAADAQHVAAELVGRFQRQRRALPALALTVDSSVLTSIANDMSYDDVFARQVEAVGARGDVLLAISTSGRSPNIVRALEKAKAMSLKTIALTGRDGGLVGSVADVHVNVPTDSAARAQEVHRTILHAMCELIETEVAGA